MTSKKKPRGQGAEPEDDDRVWAALSKSVKPIKRRTPPPPSADEGRPPPKPVDRTPPPAPPRPRRPVPAPPPVHVVKGPPELAHGDAPGVDKRTAAKLRRGLMPIEATLDLHGLGRETARDRLTSFVTGHHTAGRRCVLVITGKGLGPDWTPGVIRTAVPQWLNEPPLRPLILSFATAQPHHGGSGAIYVLLKRTR